MIKAVTSNVSEKSCQSTLCYDVKLQNTHILVIFKSQSHSNMVTVLLCLYWRRDPMHKVNAPFFSLSCINRWQDCVTGGWYGNNLSDRLLMIGDTNADCIFQLVNTIYQQPCLCSFILSNLLALPFSIPHPDKCAVQADSPPHCNVWREWKLPTASLSPHFNVGTHIKTFVWNCYKYEQSWG